MAIEIIKVDEKEKWNKIVQSFEKHDVYYLNGYAKACKVNGDGEPLLIYFDNGTTRAINVVIKRDIADDDRFNGLIGKGEYFDITTPYGYGGFIVDGECYEELEDEYSEFCKSEGIVSEFVRFNLFSRYKKQFKGDVETKTKNIVRDLDTDIDSIYMDFEHKVRKNIKNAERQGLIIEIDKTGKRIDDFLDIYYGTMKRNEAKEDFYFEKEFFHTVGKMKQNQIYFHVIYNDIVISSELVLYNERYAYSFLGGTSKDYFHLRPNDFLKFEIIKWAKTKGIKKFILGGGYGQDDGIFKYKKSFAPKGIYDFYIGKKVFDEVKYNFLLRTRNIKSEENSYFPQYRG